MASRSPPIADEGTLALAVTDRTEQLEDTLRDALSEVYILREALKGAVIGDGIISRQFSGSDDKMLAWACRQAETNAKWNGNSLTRSVEDFDLAAARKLLSPQVAPSPDTLQSGKEA
jgi:hypothetical protein